VENIFTWLPQKFYDIMGDVGGTIGDGGQVEEQKSSKSGNCPGPNML